jgi:hypothetical protein
MVAAVAATVVFFIVNFGCTGSDIYSYLTSMGCNDCDGSVGTSGGINPLDMVFVEGGAFTMGCTEEQGDDCDNNEKPAHKVTLGNYYIGTYEMTQRLWEQVMCSNPYVLNKGDNLPVSWNGIQGFILKLNATIGKRCHCRLRRNGGTQRAAGIRAKGTNIPALTRFIMWPDTAKAFFIAETVAKEHVLP